MTATLIVFTIVVVAIALLMYTTRKRMQNIPLVENHPDIIVLTDKNFQHQLKDKIVLVDFWASWCTPCRLMAPILNELAAEVDGNVYIGKLDVETNQLTARKYHVRSIPTLILFKNNVEVKRFIGVKSKDFLLQQIKNLM